ncbi:MAG TPA: hypothetical protein VMJ72_00985 [Candidatus Paceibacterota bacterium]|nr:hypothetical protein [Candidatus Paceibacterota bacterium]
MRFILAVAGAAALGYAVYRAVTGRSTSTGMRMRIARLGEREEEEQAHRLEGALHENAGLR